MNENMGMNNQMQNNQPEMQSPPPAMQQNTTPPPAMPYGRDPRTLGQYTVDRAFDAAGRELDRMDKDKPGTRRKVLGIASIGAGLAAGVTGVGVGIYLLTT